MPRRDRIAALALAALLTLAATLPAAAQDTDVSLAGMGAVRLTASPLSQAALDCRLEASELLAGVEGQLTAGGMTAVESPRNLATVTVLTAFEGNRALCSSAVMLGVYRKVSFFDEAAGWVRSGYVVVWQSGQQVLSTRDNHRAQVRESLHRLAGAMLHDWQRADGRAQQTSEN